MHIALIAPRVGFSTNIVSLNDFWSEFQQNNPYRNLWSGIGTSLLTLAALTPKNVGISFVDENHSEINFEAEYDLVAITAMTQQAHRAYEIATKFRNAGKKVVIGGTHATLLPNETIQFADSVVIGEAEYVWGEIISDLFEGRLKDFYRSYELADLKQSPIPRFDLLKPENYHFIWLQASRGCPHDCEYCTASKIFGPGYRTKSVGQIIEEIKTIQRHFPGKPISFSDDNLFVQNDFSMELIREIAKLNVKWQAQTDISIGAKDELLNLLRQSGCIMLFVGFESINENGLKQLDSRQWKLRQLKNYTEYIDKIQGAGIGIDGAFITGLDGDDETVFNSIANFITERNLYHASVTILTPFPGTRLRERLLSENRIISSDWRQYTGYNVNFQPANMSITDLENGIVGLYKNIYSSEVHAKKMEYFKKIHRYLIAKGLA